MFEPRSLPNLNGDNSVEKNKWQNSLLSSDLYLQTSVLYVCFLYGNIFVKSFRVIGRKHVWHNTDVVV